MTIKLVRFETCRKVIVEDEDYLVADTTARGEYECFVRAKNCSVLDIGANIGMFVLWASTRWTNCKYYCYEPIPETFERLRKNLTEINTDLNVELVNCAVTKKEGIINIWDKNSGFASMDNLDSEDNLKKGMAQRRITVKTFYPENLPKADILKIDTEGCEREIIQNYPYLNTVALVMLETHSQEDTIFFMNIFGAMCWDMLSSHVVRGAGVLIFKNRNKGVCANKIEDEYLEFPEFI